MDVPSLSTGRMADAESYGNVMRLLTEETSESLATQRRSSSRSIKRRRFDDELVESSLGSAGSVGKLARARNQSISSPNIGATSSTMTARTTATVTSAVAGPTVNRQRRLVSSSNERVVSSGITRRKKRPSYSPSVVQNDFARWKPTDDLALITNVMLTNDLRVVYEGTKFSCRFNFHEIKRRWHALLYNPAVNGVAVAAMRKLHPEVVASVRSRALFSEAEEKLLQKVKSSSNPKIEVFQNLLEENAQVFYQSRTAKSLYNHWKLLKHYRLLSDQTLQALPRGEHILNFSEVEDLMNDSDLADPDDEELGLELARADRLVKKEIRSLENETGNWQALIDSVSGISPPEFDNQTLAVLRGRLVRYLMRSREITIGRSTKDANVDVDLSLEGPAYKISRRQATIRLQNNGDFFLSCEGKRAIFVDGKPILTGYKYRLNNNSVIEIADFRFIFFVNQELINVIRHEAAKLKPQPNSNSK